jgi:hypothetical protein
MASPSTSPATPPASRPSSPSPARPGLRTLARMGTMLRRNSSGFGFGRQSLSRSESKSSLRGKELSSDDSAAIPSPVAESPIREAQANAAEPVQAGPSPLSQEVSTTIESALASTPASNVASAPVISAEPEHIAEPVAQKVEQAPAPAPAPAPEPDPSVNQPSSKPTEEIQPPPVTAVPTVSEPPPEKRAAVVAPSENTEPSASVPAPIVAEERAPDAFAWGDTLENTKSSEPMVTNSESVPVPPPVAPPVYASVPTRSVEATPAHAPITIPEAIVRDPSLPRPQPGAVDPYTASAAESFAWKYDGISSNALGKQPSREHFVSSPEHSVVALSKSPSREVLVASPHSVSVTLSPKASRSSLASSYGQVVNSSSGRRRVSVSVDPEDGRRGRSRSRASIR